jgi:predicted nucleic acid-binding protein
MIILDTNVASELMKPSPAPVVRDWVRACCGKELYTTSITLAEIRYGIERLPAGRRRDLLKATADDVFAVFEDQVCPSMPRRRRTTP